APIGHVPAFRMHTSFDILFLMVQTKRPGLSTVTPGSVIFNLNFIPVLFLMVFVTDILYEESPRHPHNVVRPMAPVAMS
ncbi:hypothetical protein KVP02_13385, partial [Halobacterium salinarum]|uniref:hypothetical protein n=1 Tax=Halobacterium salinarum TaxID=2242 RepID=UPI001F36725D